MNETGEQRPQETTLTEKQDSVSSIIQEEEEHPVK